MMASLQTIYLVVGLAIVISSRLGAEEGTKDSIDFQKSFEEVIAKKAWKHVDIPPENQGEFIAYAKSKLSEVRGTSAEGFWIKSLIVLADEDTIRSSIQNEGDVRRRSRDLISSGSPVAIEVLIPFLFKEEPLVNKMSSDVQITSISHYVAEAIVPEITMRSRAFDPKVVEWAKLIRTGFKPGDADGRLRWCRDVMRQWWRENEQLFRTKNYKAIRPGIKSPWPPMVVPPPDPELTTLETNTSAPRSMAPERSVQPPVTEPVPVTLAKNSNADSGSIWLFTGAAVVAVVGAAAIIVRRRNS